MRENKARGKNLVMPQLVLVDLRCEPGGAYMCEIFTRNVATTLKEYADLQSVHYLETATIKNSNTLLLCLDNDEHQDGSFVTQTVATHAGDFNRALDRILTNSVSRIVPESQEDPLPAVLRSCLRILVSSSRTDSSMNRIDFISRCVVCALLEVTMR